MKCDKCVHKGHCRYERKDYPEYMQEVMSIYCKRFEEDTKTEVVSNDKIRG